MPRTNGGIIGKRNITSFGKCKQTVKTSTGNVCTQSGTRLFQAVIVAGGAGGGHDGGGGGGAGGLRNIEVPVNGCTAVPITIGAGGAGGSGPTTRGATGGTSNIVGNDATYT